MKTKSEFYESIVRETQKTIRQIQKQRDQIRELEKMNNSGNYSIQGRSENIQKIRELERNIENLRVSGKGAVEEMCRSFESELLEEDSLKGSEMTEDANLLSSGIQLNKIDLESMLSRNKGNRTMLQLVLRYAKANDIDLGLTYVGNTETIAMLKSVPYTAEVTMKWDENASVFDRLMGESSEFSSWASE